ncbi:MAG: hypothetical protein V4511_09635 [Bacteroidota bacterium]
MTATQIKKQIETYLPLLTIKQQELLLDMVKNILHVESADKRITKKQYNKEIAEAEKRIARGEFTTQGDLEKEMKGW